MKRKEKLSRRQKRAKRRSIFKTLFLLSVTLIFNTYAWFLYTTTVSSNLTAHVDAWHVEFRIDDKTKDTNYGTTSYEYSQVNSGKAAIEMSIKLIVTQDETS